MATTPRTGSTEEIPDGLSPYEFWNFGAGRPFVFSSAQRSSPFLAAVAELQPAKRTMSGSPTPAGEPVKVWLPTLWKAKGHENKPFALTYVPFIMHIPEKDRARSEDVAVTPQKLRKWLLEGLQQENIQKYLKSVDIERSRFRVGLPVAHAAMNPFEFLKPTAPNWQPDTELRARIGREKRITIFAIIDDGLPFAHRNFRDASGRRTRVEFCWLQSAKVDKQRTSVLFGREYLRTDIERYIAQHGDDEDTLYREAGATDETEGLASMIERHNTHGAHVMDLAAGYAPERGEQPAEEIRIIGVQLPNVVTMDTSGIGKDMYLLSAFHYIFDRADEIAEKYQIERPRLVINFSYGYFGGPHDGQLDTEAAITELVELRRKKCPTALILPAGNGFLDRMHASIPDRKFVEGEGEVRLRWRLQPTDRTPNFVELWFPRKYEPVGYTVVVKDSRDVERGALPVGVAGGNTDRVIKLINDKGAQIGQLSVDRQSGRWRVLLVTAPSDLENPEKPQSPSDPNVAAVAAGLWTIVLKRDPSAAPLGRESIRCWIQRDTDPTSLRSGARQSFFEDADDVGFEDDGSPREVDTDNALLRRFGSLSGLATTSCALVVAGFRLDAGLGSPDQTKPVSYSCAGTRNAGWPHASVICSSMSDRAKVLPGTAAAGTRSGSRSVLRGTSVAAPFVARQLTTTFVSASDKDVESAGKRNYIDLLRGIPPDPPKRPPNARRTLRKIRLGTVLVPPHWQPGTQR